MSCESQYKPCYTFPMFYNVAAPLIHYRFSSLDPHESVVQHAIFTRHGGVSKEPFNTLNFRYGIGDPDVAVTQNRHIAQGFFEGTFLGGKRTTMISANQTHSDHIMILRADEKLPETVMRAPHEVDDVDAFVTDRRDITLLIQVADCQPVLLFDPGNATQQLVPGGATRGHRPVLGVVHSGWRGSVQNIIGKTVARMRDEFGAEPSRLLVGVGPSIGTCCNYFTDPANELPKEFHPYILPDKRVDFLRATQDQLMHEGVREEHIEFSGICSCDTTSDFFSYRRENRLTGRFGLVAGLV